MRDALVNGDRCTQERNCCATAPCGGTMRPIAAAAPDRYPNVLPKIEIGRAMRITIGAASAAAGNWTGV